MKKKIFMGLGAAVLAMASIVATKANNTHKFSGVNYYTYSTGAYVTVVNSACGITPFTSGTGTGTPALFKTHPVYWGSSHARANFKF